MPIAAPWMSSLSFGSFDVAENSVTAGFGSQLSLATTVALMFHIVWFGGQRALGLAAAAIVGGIVSRTVTRVSQLDGFPEPSVAVKVTTVVPSG